MDFGVSIDAVFRRFVMHTAGVDRESAKNLAIAARKAPPAMPYKLFGGRSTMSCTAALRRN
jgi:hypothetical protein